MSVSISRRGLAALAAILPLGLTTAPSRAAEPAAGARMFFTPQALAQARRLREGPLAAAWKTTRSVADAARRAGPVRYGQHEDPPGSERNWQREVGNVMATAAAVAIIEPSAADRDFAVAQTLEAATYPLWGADKLDGADLAAGHLLFGSAMVLDWLGDGMDAADRARIVDTLRRRGGQMVAATHGRGRKPAYWAEAWMQNHLWVSMTSLLAAGIALQGADPVASAEMIATASDRMTRAFAALPEDGSSQEGPGYWDYGAEYLLKFHALATERLGLALDGHWLHEAAAYRAAMVIPSGGWTHAQSMFNQADAPLSPWYGPDYMLRRLAALNRDSTAQDLAARLEAAGAVRPSAPWLNLVWYDPAVPRAGSEAIPLLRHFSDIDLVVARSDHSGRESVVVMRAGPPLGKRAQAARYTHDVGVGHVHPDVNHVTLFGAGAFLLRDDGYAGLKDTAHHNTLLVNGLGQIGSGREWTKFPSYPLPDPQPKIVALQSQPLFDYWVGEGAAAYPAEAGLRRFDRHVLFVKPGMLVVIDDLDAAENAAFTLLWHPGAAAMSTGEQRYRATIEGAALQMAFVLPAGGTHQASGRAMMTHEHQSATLEEVAVTFTARTAQCGALLSWGAASAPPSLARLTHDAGVWTLTGPGQTLRLNVGEKRVVPLEVVAQPVSVAR